MELSLSQRRPVGKTGLDLPVFGLGTAHLGEMYALVDEAASRATLEQAWDAGVRFYDTAPWYGRGLSEHRLGGFLRTKPRADFMVTTKVGRTLHRPKDPATFDRAPWLGGLNFEIRFDYGHDGAMRSYEQSLQRLALDTVDALLIHDLDTMHHGDRRAEHLKALAGGGIRALQELKSSGDIKAIGMGINSGESLEEVANEVPLDFVLVAMPYTLLDQAILTTGMAQCVRRGISVIIGAPFASGILATGSTAGAKYAYGAAPPQVQAKVRDIEAVCGAHGVSLQAAALQFPLAHPAVVSIIPGAMRAEEVRQNVASLQAPIPAAFWAELKTRGLLHSDAPVPGGSAG
jgi:D-threo-aldose 1-dehydrogenase